jgi:hypothetical protein
MILQTNKAQNKKYNFPLNYYRTILDRFYKKGGSKEIKLSISAKTKLLIKAN